MSVCKGVSLCVVGLREDVGGCGKHVSRFNSAILCSKFKRLAVKCDVWYSLLCAPLAKSHSISKCPVHLITRSAEIIMY